MTATLHTVFVLLVVAPACRSLIAQPAEVAAQTEAKKAADVLHAIDQLIEQNRKLEQQNRELMQQIDSLRQLVANQDGHAADPVPAQNPRSSARPNTSATPPSSTANQSSGQSQSNGDDKALLPQASDGKPGVFGEFNPGRGFTVAKRRPWAIKSQRVYGSPLPQPIASRPNRQRPFGSADHRGTTQ